jgi:hypothetical protein
MIVDACCIHNFTLDIPFALPNDAVDNNDRQDEEHNDADDDCLFLKMASFGTLLVGVWSHTHKQQGQWLNLLYDTHN